MIKRTISGMIGVGSLAHNRRDFVAENVNPDRVQLNICYKNENLKEVYKELFDDAVERYNVGKRKDRQIANYYEKIRQGKQEKLFHEVIFQIGNREDMAVGTTEGDLAVRVLDEYMKDFQKRNPSLRVFSCYLHQDEATPHLHIDFVPYVTNWKGKGMDTRVSLKQALKSLGFQGGNKHDTELNQWINHEKEVLAEIAKQHGIEWEELSIIQGERITLNILNEASKRFYKERLVQFFEESKTAKMTYNERIESLELNKLLNQIIDKEKTIKTNIRTNQYTAVIFQKERNNPYTSHFYIAQELEPYLGSLELNFFISKYNEMSNKSGKKVSIYALNYGLCMDENLRWGKPKGNEYRTYFIESPFNFTPVIKNFLSENKKIYCENCMHEFSEEEYNLMKKYGGTCLKCGCKNSIQEKRVLSDEERSEIEEIEKKDNLLEREQYQLLKLLQYSRKDKTATELAQELDVSWQKIGWIAKKIEEDYCYLKKEPRKGKMYYVLSDLGREYLDSITP
ncbi:plasmid recombination protein [Blautia obeum]|uniref:plasmid recombination protein n=1 Tax=Blautia obeum TaxID=40520 RepID=UPI003219F7CD